MSDKDKPAPTLGTLTERQHRIHEFLKMHPTGVLSTVDPNGDPHGVVIHHVIDKGFGISFLTRANTHKYDNIRFNNHVMLTVYETRSQTVAQVIGEAIEITDAGHVNEVAAAVLGSSLRAGAKGLPPITKLQVGPYAAFKIVPTQIRMAVYAKPNAGDYDAMFESLESFELNV